MSPEQGEKSTQIRIELISGVEGDCIGINDYRVAGSKPWGGGTVERSWSTTKEDVLMAFLTPDDKHKWLGKDLAVISVNERDQLLSSLAEKQEEIEKLRRALQAYVEFSHEAALKLDRDEDHKCLKLLLSMAGEVRGYRHDVDEARAALNPISEPQEH